MGSLRITEKGLKLEGDSEFLEPLYAKEIQSKPVSHSRKDALIPRWSQTHIALLFKSDWKYSWLSVLVVLTVLNSHSCLFRWHSHELHRALTLSLKLHQSAPAVITLAACWRHVAFSPINATLCLLAQYKCKWLAWRKSLRSVTPCEWRQSIWGEKVQRCEVSNDCECDSVNLRSLHLTVGKSMCDKNLS